jgi:hypothetical protein
MNDIEKEFIPYQQSLDMKKLGFDKPCFSYYKNDQLSKMLEEVINSKIRNVNNEVDDYISAPTYSQAFRFFREKYKIRFFIQSGMSDLGEFFKVIFPNGEVRSMSYPTYEEAELVCLTELIQIVKTNIYDTTTMA